MNVYRKNLIINQVNGVNLVSWLFFIFLEIKVVKKEGASMFVRVIKNNKGKKNTCFCALVESYRDSSGVPKHRVLINFGQVDEESVPFLKAAFAKKKPRLVYDDE